MPRSQAAVVDRPDRKQAILLAAERLFAQDGYHAVSLRAIADEAGVPLALVNYYYGQKHELFEAIFAHWAPTIEQRLAGLREAMQAPQRQRLPQVVRAFVEPVLRMRASPEGEFYALLVARELYLANEVTDHVLRSYFDPLAQAFIDAFQSLLPHASRAQVAWCYQFMLGALMHHLSDNRIERLSRGEGRVADPAAHPLLIDFIVGGLRAALPRPSPAPRTTTTRRRPA